MPDFLHQKCLPCEGGVGPLPTAKAEEYLKVVPGWTLPQGGKHISRMLVFKDFSSAISFLNESARLAEVEGHHPDLHLTSWNHLAIELSTHAIGGLSENDFIMAAKLNQLWEQQPFARA